MGTAKETPRTRIVVGVDLSATGDHALREAIAITHGSRGELHVTYVIEESRELHDASRIEELESELQIQMNALRSHVRSAGVPPKGARGFSQECVFHIRIGDPAEALHQVAVDVDADMIVVGTQGRTGIDKLILGSVAQDLVQTARVPVLVARRKDYSGLPKSPEPEPPRAGQPASRRGLTERVHLELLPRVSHISGLL